MGPNDGRTAADTSPDEDVDPPAVADDGMAPLINNTGADDSGPAGDAASG